jgi:hypothetical protein
MAVLTLCLVAGCGGADEPEVAATQPSTQSSSAASATPEPAAPSGTPAPEALSAFRCEADTKDRWVAAGFLSNDGDAAATYQVSVYVGPLDGTAREVRTQEVPNVASGGSVRFEITEIPAESKQCHVQVLRTQ